MAFRFAVRRDDVPAGSIREVHLDGRTIAVANLEGRYFAIDNTCLHRGGPLGKGTLNGSVVTCPWHGWTYEVTTGRVTFHPSMAVATYPVEERGEEIWVDAG